MSKPVKKEYDVSEIKNGYFICWSVCTQACFGSTISLSDDNGHVYFKYEKKPSDKGDLKVLGQGNEMCKGNKLKLTICSETASGELYQSINSYNVTDNSAKTVGHGYNLCIEDGVVQSGDDNHYDFNDIYVDLIGWVHKG